MMHFSKLKSKVVIQKLEVKKSHCVKKKLNNFYLIVFIAFLYVILFQFNYSSKELQNISVDLATAVDSIEHTCKWSYRNDGFETAIAIAKEIATDLQFETI